MKLLNAGYLWLLLLVIVPVILHFLLRERVQRVIFSTLRFLRRQHREVLVRKRWLEWLLTGLRMVCLAVLVLAFARPFFQANAAPEPGKRAARICAILIDVSRSMAYADKRFDEAKEQAFQIIEKAPADALLRIVSFSDAGSAQSSDAHDRLEARALVQQLKPTHGSTDILDAMDQTFKGLDPQGEGDVWLVSDLQETAVSKTREPQLPRGFKFHVAAVGKSGKVEGVALSGGSSYIEVLPGTRNFSITARVIGFGRERNAQVQALVEGADGKEKEVYSREIHVPQNGEATALMNGTLTDVGEHGGRLVLKGDGGALLKGDEQFNFVVRVVKKIRVAVINGNPNPADGYRNDAAYFLVEALNAPPIDTSSSPFEAKEYKALPDLKDVDVVLLAAVPKLPAADAQRLGEWVANGGGLIAGMAPAMDDAAMAGFNGQFAQYLPAGLRKWRSGDEWGNYLVGSDFKHPLWQRLNSENTAAMGLARPRFLGAYELKDSQDAIVVLRFDDGKPALLQKHIGKGSALMFAGVLDFRASNFPRCGMFLPFMWESVRLLAERGERASQLTMGQTIPVPADATLKLPDGKTAVKGGPSVMHVVSEPGIYRLEAKDHSELFAVNTDPEESNLHAKVAEDFEKQFVAANTKAPEFRKVGGSYVRLAAGSEDLRAEHSWFGFGIGWWALAGLIVLTVVEMWLGRVVSQR